jgi:hypothetical protein
MGLERSPRGNHELRSGFISEITKKEKCDDRREDGRLKVAMRFLYSRRVLTCRVQSHVFDKHIRCLISVITKQWPVFSYHELLDPGHTSCGCISLFSIIISHSKHPSLQDFDDTIRGSFIYVICNNVQFETTSNFANCSIRLHATTAPTPPFAFLFDMYYDFHASIF